MGGGEEPRQYQPQDNGPFIDWTIAAFLCGPLQICPAHQWRPLKFLCQHGPMKGKRSWLTLGCAQCYGQLICCLREGKQHRQTCLKLAILAKRS